MKRFKTAAVAALLTGALSVPALANEDVPMVGNDMQDTAKVFEVTEGQSMEVAALSSEEMASTEGAWVVHAVRAGWGAIGGGVSYSVTNVGTDNFSWGGLASSTASGAVGGLVGWNSPMAATFGAGASAASNRWAW